MAKEVLKYKLNLLDAATLLYNMHQGAMDPDVGFEDADRTLRDITRSLNFMGRGTLTKPVLESTLWSCNMMSEQGKFWSPRGETFQQFVNRILKDYDGEFDEIYNLIIPKKGN